jgi:O-antigen/teichoic acid export membrane protein
VEGDVVAALAWVTDLGAHDKKARVSDRRRQLAFVRMLGSAVTSQALLSAASFVVGLLLIRHVSELQYGYFVLASGAVLLMTALQNSFLNPPLVNRITPLDGPARGDLVGGLYRDQNRVLTVGGALAFAVACGLWLGGILDRDTGPLIIVTIGAALATLHRHFFRMVLLAHRRPQDVLVTDICYVALLVLGVYLAIRLPAPAAGALVVMGVAAAVSGILLARLLWRHESWDVRGAVGILREVAPLAAWSMAGGAIHWTFSQGYMYIAAGTLDLTAVAAIAATRLLLMPVNLLSSGIGTMMLPLTAGWLHHRGSAFALRRLSLFALGLACAALCYFAVLWLTRDWIFTAVLQKQFAHQDALLLLWGLAFLPMVIRDQLLYLLVARQRFRQLTSLAFVGAVISLLAGYVGMVQFGVLGAPLGVLVGELINLTGIVVLSVRQGGVPQAAPAGRAEIAA